MKYCRSQIVLLGYLLMSVFVSCRSESDKVVTVNFTDVNKKRGVKLSEWVSEPEFIALDSNCEEAFEKGAYCCVSDNHIGMYGSGKVFKLYDRKTGEFLRDIGHIGKGNGEYGNVYSSVIDEQNSMVYILPWNAKEVLGYDINNGELKVSRPLKCSVPKGAFAIDSLTGDLTVAALPFEGINKTVAWKQDCDNKIFWEIPANHLSVIPDFSFEINSGFNTEDFDLSINTLGIRADSLYVVKEGFIEPIFTMNFLSGGQSQKTGNRNLPNHTYTLLPKHILTSVNMQIRKPNGQIGFSKPIYVITDRKTGKSFIADFQDDILSRKLDYVLFKQGYYLECFSAEVFIKTGKSALAKGNLSETTKARISSILKTLTPESNDVVVLAPLKL